LKATVEAFSRAYAAANPNEQAALRARMRGVILSGKVSRKDLDRGRRAEKECIEARDRRILEFPLSISRNAVAKARPESVLTNSISSFTSEYNIAGGRISKWRSIETTH
jgi:hypothetical protein